MKEMPAGKFKAHCLAVLDEVAESREEVIITKRGKAVAKLVPLNPECAVNVIGWMKNRGRIVGDIVGPNSDCWEPGTTDPLLLNSDSPTD